jgi:hypothetical protein
VWTSQRDPRLRVQNSAKTDVGIGCRPASQYGIVREAQRHASNCTTVDKMSNQIQNLHTIDTDTFPYVFEQNASVPLKSSEGLIRLNVYRPKADEKVPVLVTYGPYGKDIPYKE